MLFDKLRKLCFDNFKNFGIAQAQLRRLAVRTSCALAVNFRKIFRMFIKILRLRNKFLEAVAPCAPL